MSRKYTKFVKKIWRFLSVVEIYFFMSQITVVKVCKIQQFCTSIVQKLLTGKSSIIYLLMPQITIVKVGKIWLFRAIFFYVILLTSKLCRNLLIYDTKYNSKVGKIKAMCRKFLNRQTGLKFTYLGRKLQ